MMSAISNLLPFYRNGSSLGENGVHHMAVGLANDRGFAFESIS